MNGLIERLVGATQGFQETMPVYRIMPQSLEERAELAIKLASNLGDPDAGENKYRIARKPEHSEILLPEGLKVRIAHASGAISIDTGLAPMEHLIGHDVDRKSLTELAIKAARRLGVDSFLGRGEQLLFERLWQIKANGINERGVKGREVICRAIGAFRRHIGSIPIWGSASAYVEVAAGGRIGSAGIDWRPFNPEPVDDVKILEPERAASSILRDLNGRLPGGELTEEDFDVAMFGLGYISLPKRRDQGEFAPAYVALLKRKGWTSRSYAIVVPASEGTSEGICRRPEAPPRQKNRRDVPERKSNRPTSGKWDPLTAKTVQ